MNAAIGPRRAGAMPPPAPRILAINGGSSSVKFALFEAVSPMARVCSGNVERIGQPHTRLRIDGAPTGDASAHASAIGDHVQALDAVIACLRERGEADGVVAIGHRLVHGGPDFSTPQRLNAEVVAKLRKLVMFDPEHLPAEIALIQAAGRHYPQLPQVACFDTAFHHALPQVAQWLAIPRRYWAQGVRRYGFHGLSYQYLIGELARVAGTDVANGRVILAHLGHGASISALRHGKPVDTSMGFTPASGLPMGQRCGDIDPGLAWFLAQTEGMDAERCQQMLTTESGLLGVSETSSDMRDLLACEADDVRAADAVALFCHQTKKAIAGLAASIGGIDTLVFAGGIGENAAPVRARICADLGFLGIVLDPQRNAAHAALISSTDARVQVRVIHTDEERVIALAVADLLNDAAIQEQ
ncbi:MAG: acetate/propionate family kinase [Xanthomonadaceae bacterium]|nr:acetate/propionate family kinase [Xanthomonadaceae bacterium]MDP2186273.1 acetate/propionate family kinase [Xanthomonadales bacterium]MDZ4117654.1 acetate/propionate family kinase [Xanthomonadaceae bacterium]MDZ4379314.1 acetate/propionate family kinase [Xanthomonadaceae bacterium]